MLTLKNFFVAAVAVSALLAAIGGMTPSNAQSARPAEEVIVVNTPTVQAQQAGTWTVGAQLAPGTTVGISGTPAVSISGTPAVSISGTPTVNVASLPAFSVDLQPALPAVPFMGQANLTVAAPEAVFGHPEGTIGLTAITITNFASTPVQAGVSHAIMASPNTCISDVVGGALPQEALLVPPRSTLHLTYPTALVFSPINDAACIEVSASGFGSGSVFVTVNGFRQF